MSQLQKTFMKKGLLLGVAFILYIISFSQTWKELNDSTFFYIANQDFQKGILFGEQAVLIAKKEFGTNHLNYATSIFVLASQYDMIFQYEKAELLYIEAIEIIKTKEGINSRDYVRCLTILASMYAQMGQYGKAESLFLEIKETGKKVLGENSPAYAKILNNLGELYEKLGQYVKAGRLYLDAMEIWEKENSIEYISSINHLAHMYQMAHQYATADTLYQQLIILLKQTLGENNANYAAAIDNLASLYKEMGEFEKAEPLQIEAIRIKKIVLGVNDPDYAIGLNKLAFLYKAMGKYEKVEPLYIEALGIVKKVLGINNPAYADRLNNLAIFYQERGEYKKAEPMLSDVKKNETKNLLEVFNVLSEKEKNNYLEFKAYVFYQQNSFLYSYQKAGNDFVKENYNLQLVLKSLALSNSKKVIESIRNNRDSTVQYLYNQWQLKKSTLSQQYAIPITKRRSDLQQIEEQTENLEKELTRRSTEFRQQQQNLQIKIEDVQKKLEKDGAAIEFVDFRLYTKGWTDSTIYAAYILRKNDSVPSFVPLCEEKQFNKYFTNSRSSSGIKSLYRSEPIDETSTEVFLGDSLYALIWKPLLPYLNGITKISYSPSGLLNRVAFQALPTPDGQLLIDKYEMNQYISTRQLAVEEEKTKTRSQFITLFGDCAFTMDSISIVKNIPPKSGVSNIYSSGISRDENKGSWRQLEGTATEINQIKNLFAKNKIDTASFMQQKATEEQFKNLSGNSPTILHLATHGFFLPDPEQKRKEGFEVLNTNTFKLSDDPMMRSGIVLSGANRVWSGQAPIEGREDGIVTAYEISQLDLHNTELVVLSACETALGDIKGTEGVFGLQRAFKLAGVKSLLLSLWKVPDKETAELMTTFYQYYLAGNSLREALHKAQMDMKKKYRPYYWAAFVLIE
ncbi:MAG: CHAT domain-containing protein [Bacteroidetes bacterium]|nr:MAG: CHAT domain-containing protein [Bacteroidota bacterium]